MERLQKRVRDPRAGYVQSLEVLQAAKACGVYTKSSIMLGLGAAWGTPGGGWAAGRWGRQQAWLVAGACTGFWRAAGLHPPERPRLRSRGVA